MLWLAVAVGSALAAPSPQGGGHQGVNGCSGYNEYGFFCVPIFQCSSEGIIKTDARGLFDPRSGANCDPDSEYLDNEDCCPPDLQRALGSSCSAQLDVCCLHPNSTDQYKEANLAAFDCNNDQVSTTTELPLTECSEDDELFGICSTDPDPDLPIFQVLVKPSSNEPSCGRRNPAGTASVSTEPSADDAEFGEWPHVCAILKKEFIGNEAPLKIYQCGASLIDDNILLTAAHCLDGISPDNLIVRCGEWNTQNEDEPEPYQEIQVEGIEMHPQFNIGNHHNNFALLFTSKPFERKPHISPICLPEPCHKFTEDNCVANGWGKDKFGSNGRYSTILKEVIYPIVSHDQCQNDLRQTRLGEFFELDDSFICAGGIKGVDTCKGDGGSPLTCRVQGRRDTWVQAGIVSWGIGCGEQGTPAVYASVAAVVCWIDNEVKNKIGASRFGFLQNKHCNGAEPLCQDINVVDIQDDTDERSAFDFL